MPKCLRVYEYGNCDTCRKALTYLTQRGVAFERVDIVKQPPTLTELKKMLKYLDGDLRRLFNTSGQVYRELGMSEKLKSLTDAAALALLAQHGKLVKRPFVLGESSGVVGFKEPEWKALLAAL